MIYRYIFTLILVTLPVTIFCQNIPGIKADLTTSHITIDGYLKEDAWHQSYPVTEFRQFEPNEGELSARKTEVRILFGKDDLYISAIMYDDAEYIENNLGRRDEYNRADWFMVSIDSYNNKRTAYTFAVNAANVQLDGQHDDNKKLSISDVDPALPDGLDPSWNAIWFSSVKITDESWIAEIRIPYSMLRFSKMELQTWGFQFSRRIPRLGEISEWPFIPRNERSNLVSGYGQVSGIKGIAPKRNIQIKPYLLSGLDFFENENNPGTGDYRLKYDVGGDIKIGLGSNVILDATISPDFGQVEADPAVLNLTAFETFFAEKRPFFLEGADIFKFGIGNSRLFYTRRFGANEPIIAAAKLSGQTEQGLSFGILGTTAGKNFNPSHNYGVIRASHILGQYSSIGGIFTVYNSPLSDGIGWKSMTGGVDWDMRFNDNKFSFEGISAFSDRTSLLNGKDEKGLMSGLVLRKREGIIDGHFTLLMFTDKYNPNDMGWISYEQNWYQIWSGIAYKLKSGQSFGPFQRGNINLHYTRRYSFLELYDMGSTISLRTDLTTKEFRKINIGGRFNDLLGGYDIWETRGLGIWSKPINIEVSGEYTTDDRLNWNITPKGSFKKFEDSGSEYSLQLNGKLNAGTRLSFQMNMKGSWEDSKTAWASNESFFNDAGIWKIGESSVPPEELLPADFTVFDENALLGDILAEVEQYAPGQYYVPVFGERDTRSLDLTLRGSLTFTSKFSIQLYTQLFLARGRYENFSIMTNPDLLAEFSRYPKKRDFAYKNLQSNFVTRWEYRPGSAIYLVWSHGRNVRDEMNPLAPYGVSHYEQTIPRQIGDIFNIFPNNSFMVKFDYAFF